MVQQPAPVTPGQPSRRRLALRRTIAAVVLLALLALGGWGAASALRSVRDSDPPPPVTRALPHPKPLRIIFPEGFTRAEMADRITAVNGIARSKRHVRTKLSARAYTRLTASSRFPGKFAGDRKRRTLEGFLFPATYQFLPKTTTRELVDDQLEAFRRSWKKVGLRYARSKKLTPYDVLIIASMIEKETAAPSERRLVAAVIYNRLHARMALFIDATLRYALHVPPTESLRKSHLRNPTPYNTRLHRGLPPTPIANPGLASMRAAAHPAKVDYLYYARKPDKVHHFFTASESKFLEYLDQHGYGG